MSLLTDRLSPKGRTLGLERPGRRAAACRPAALQGAVAAPLAAVALGTTTSRRPTLDDLLVGAWEDLCAAHAADCPVCGGTMLSRRGAGPAAGATAACEDCGSSLS